MRKRKKKRSTGETAFLTRRREAVANAVAKVASSKADMPAWMQALSSKLWTKKHNKEIDFNREKLRRKRIEAFRRGGYVPESGTEKSSLELELKAEDTCEQKRRKEWQKKINERHLASCQIINHMNPHDAPFQSI